MYVRVRACVSTCTGRDNMQESVLCVLPPGFGLQFPGLATSPLTQPLAGSDFGFWKVLTWLLRSVIWCVTENVHCEWRDYVWTDVEWQVFLRAVGLVASFFANLLSDDLGTGENVLLRPVSPSGQSLFSHHLLSTLRTTLSSCWIDLSFQPPSALPY